VDSNVLLDIVSSDPRWRDWSASKLEECAIDGPLFINPIIYAEVSINFASIEALDDALPGSDYKRLQIPSEAAFLAGKAFLRYRKSGGSKNATLPDFFIGAHAAVTNLNLLTRDAKRYRTYFPTVNLIAPE
jgi:predicted nucleic acid-binding protein